MDLAVTALAFVTIFVVELPDKTFIATLVLATRYRSSAVWLGVGAAFFVQTLLAVTAGKVVTLLPAQVVHGVAGLIFLTGAIILFRQAPRADAEEAAAEETYAVRAAAPRTWWSAVGTSFLVLFAAEWGDLSQLLTISLVGRHDAPVAVFIGAWVALLTVSGLAILAGRLLLQHIRLSVIHYAGAVVCLVLALVTGYDLLR